MLKRADARLSVSLVVVDLRTMCILLTVADSERVRPREAGTEKMANFDRFPLFSAALEKPFGPLPGTDRKRRESIKRRTANGYAMPTPPLLHVQHNTVGQCLSN